MSWICYFYKMYIYLYIISAYCYFEMECGCCPLMQAWPACTLWSWWCRPGCGVYVTKERVRLKRKEKSRLANISSCEFCLLQCLVLTFDPCIHHQPHLLSWLLPFQCSLHHPPGGVSAVWRFCHGHLLRSGRHRHKHLRCMTGPSSF